MSDDSLARRYPTPSPEDADYDAIHATVVATERGRWFLDQFANRYRGADTDRVLAAIERIEHAVRGGSTAAPDRSPDDSGAMLETILQARNHVLADYGDPAASGEAAIGEFRNAVEQVRELVWATHGRDPDSDLNGQLSFQTNRLAAAAERLQRSISALSILLGAFDEIDRHAHRPAPVAEAAPGPVPEGATMLAVPEPASFTRDVSPPELPKRATIAGWDAAARDVGWHSPTGDVSWDIPETSEEPQAALETPEEAVAETAPTPTGALWDMTVAAAEAVEDRAEPAQEAALESSVTDWAFADSASEPDAEAEQPEPPGAEHPPVPEAPEPPRGEMAMSALERLEAREYGRRRLAPAPPLWQEEGASAPAAEPGALSHPGSLDDLVVGIDSAEESVPPPLEYAPEPLAEDRASDPMENDPQAGDWDREPQPSAPAPEAIFDTDLFDNEEPAAVPSDSDGAARLLATSADDWAAPSESTPASKQPELPGVIGNLMEQSVPDLADEVEAEPVASHRFLQEELELSQSETVAAPRPSPLLEPSFDEDDDRPRPPPADQNLDTSAVLERLEGMRNAIAALMQEVSDKTTRRNPRT
jgi:hypothetical protein